MFCCGDNLREYCYTQLKEPMIAGKTYRIEFWVRPAVAYGTAINSFGAHFSKEKVTGQGGLGVIGLEEHVGNPVDRILIDTNAWLLIKGDYLAKGGELYMTIGNFKNDQDTEKKVFKQDCIRSDRSYILLDAISVEEKDSEKTILVDSVTVLQQVDIKRVTRDVFYAKSSEIVLELWDNNLEDGDSVTILVNDKVFSEELAITKRVKTLHLTLEEDESLIEIRALNLGLKPPNTLAIKISDGHSEKKVILSSDLTMSQAVKIIWKL
jgi:hypothetical protein